MRFYTKRHLYDCGIDLHAGTMYVCVLNQEGQIVLHRNMPSAPEFFLKAIAPYREDIAVAVECIFTWYWLADLCAKKNIPFVLGHALYMKAIHGGKAKNDKIDAHKIAVLLRGGMLPMAYVYPAEMRSTRDLLRRRMHLMHKRSELLAHIQNTDSQYCLPQFGKKIAYKKNREDAVAFASGVLRAFDQPGIGNEVLHGREALDVVDLVEDDQGQDLSDARHRAQRLEGINVMDLGALGDVELHLGEEPVAVIDQGEVHLDGLAHAFIRKVLGYTSGAKIGNVHLKWAFSEASVLFLRQNPQAKRYLDQLTSKHGKAKALSVLAQKLGRAVYFMLQRQKAFDSKKFFIS